MLSGLRPSIATLRAPLVCLALAAVGLLPGCARLSDTAKNMFVSSTSAVAVVGGQLVQGDLQVYSDYSGFVALASQPPAAPLQCSGRLPNSSTFGREIDLRCSNGKGAHLRLSLRTDLRGFAYGGEGDSRISLAFGLDPGETVALLEVPPGMVLAYHDGKYALAPREAAPRAPQLPPAEAAGAGVPAPVAAPAAVPQSATTPPAAVPVAQANPWGEQVIARLSGWSQQLRQWLDSSKSSPTATP